jgi:alcohol dehydrogenase (cytochrome c)
VSRSDPEGNSRSSLSVPVANPSPDFVLSLREGNDLYTNSVLVLDAQSGSYVNHFQISPRDWHDWDVSNAPALIQTTGSYTHFCPGAVGGGEWNGVAYDAQTNLVFSGEDDFGRQDPHSQWGGWLYATDADTGQWKWRLKTTYPILGGVTATAGGLVVFGDMGGNFYAVDASNGQRLWNTKLDGAIGGGVVTYSAGGSQKVAVAAGLTSIFWPTEQATAKIVILGPR